MRSFFGLQRRSQEPAQAPSPPSSSETPAESYIDRWSEGYLQIMEALSRCTDQITRNPNLLVDARTTRSKLERLHERLSNLRERHSREVIDLLHEAKDLELSLMSQSRRVEGAQTLQPVQRGRLPFSDSVHSRSPSSRRSSRRSHSRHRHLRRPRSRQRSSQRPSSRRPSSRRRSSRRPSSRHRSSRRPSSRQHSSRQHSSRRPSSRSSSSSRRSTSRRSPSRRRSSRRPPLQPTALLSVSQNIKKQYVTINQDGQMDVRQPISQSRHRNADMQTHQGSRLNRSGVHSPRPSSRTNRLPQVPSIRVPSMIDSAQENRSSPTITIIQDTLPNARTGSPLSQTSATPTQPLRALSISSREHGLLSPSGVPLEPHFSPTR